MSRTRKRSLVLGAAVALASVGAITGLIFGLREFVPVVLDRRRLPPRGAAGVELLGPVDGTGHALVSAVALVVFLVAATVTSSLAVPRASARKRRIAAGAKRTCRSGACRAWTCGRGRPAGLGQHRCAAGRAGCFAGRRRGSRPSRLLPQGTTSVRSRPSRLLPHYALGSSSSLPLVPLPWRSSWARRTSDMA